MESSKEDFQPMKRARLENKISQQAIEPEEVTLKVGRERVEAACYGGIVNELRLAVFSVPVTCPHSVAHIMCQGTTYLYVHDEDSFVGRGRFVGAHHLNFSEHTAFAVVKAAVLKEFEIGEVISDALCNDRDVAFGVWQECMAKAVADVDVDATNIIEICKIERIFQKHFDQTVEILSKMAEASSLSEQFKEASRGLVALENRIRKRNDIIGCFEPNLHSNLLLLGIPQLLQQAILNAVNVLYSVLEKDFRDKDCCMSIIEKDMITLRKDPLVFLRFRPEDVQMFVAVKSILVQMGLFAPLANTYRQVWSSFVKTVKECTFVPMLATTIYPFLFKKFLETMKELDAETVCGVIGRSLDLMEENGSWDLCCIKRDVDGDDILCQVLEEDCRFVIHMMEHTKPGIPLTTNTIINCVRCSPKKELASQNIGCNQVSLEPLIWNTILNNTIEFLLQSWRRKVGHQEGCAYEELLKSLEAAYQNYVQSCDSFESCRITARDVVRFSAQMFEHVARISRPADVAVLRNQTGFVRNMMDIKTHGSRFGKYLPQLVSEFVQYWENRRSFDASIASKFTHEILAEKLVTMCDELHTTLNFLLDKETLSPNLILDFLRSFNEFLTYFERVDFTWLVEITPNMQPVVSYAIGRKVRGVVTVHYKITDHAAFVDKLNAADVPIPKHYVLSVAQRLVSLVVKCLADGDEEARVKGGGSLLTAIREAFIHLEDQINYKSFEQFEKDICGPFEKVVENINSYNVFKRQLDYLENFYTYTRKQDKIDIEKVLDMFACHANKVTRTGAEEDFVLAFDANVLKECYKKYNEAFNMYLSDHYNGNGDISDLLKEGWEDRNQSTWDEMFKREKIPLLLGGIAAWWSVRESVNVIDTGHSIKPNCIQILCVLRLLSVDQDGGGVRKHLAEVLTGQGKSLVLALLASVLALTGHTVQIVCYSQYLANRDWKAFEEFFESLDLEYQISYGTFEDMANKVLIMETNLRSYNVRQLTKDLILDTLEVQGDNAHLALCDVSNVLLIDEVDVFFTTQFYGNLYRPLVTPGMKALVLIQEMIWKLVSGMATENSLNGHVKKIMSQYVKDIVEENRDESFTKFYNTTTEFFDTHLEQMIEDATRVFTGEAEDDIICNYKLSKEGHVISRDANGLFKSENYSGYVNAFNYLRLKKKDFNHMNYNNYGYLSVPCGCVSYAELPKEFPVILGVSGTLSMLSIEEKVAIKHYGINCVSHMPNFFGRVGLTFCPHDDFKIKSTEEKWHGAILESIKAQQDMHRSVIVFFDTERDIEKFTARFHNELTGVNTLTGNEAPLDLEQRINDAGVVGSVTFAIRAMGRGVDYKSSMVVEQNGGIHVIQTFLSLDVKEEVQIKGRTARKDNQGSYELIICKEKLSNSCAGLAYDELKCTTYAELDKARKKAASRINKGVANKIEQALVNHKSSIMFIKSFEKYKPHQRSRFFIKYPFGTEVSEEEF